MAGTGRTLPLPYLMSIKGVIYYPNCAKLVVDILHASM
jgi:hypothetical protein